MNANVSGEDFDEAFKRARDMDASLDEQLRTFAEAARQRRPDFAEAVDRLDELSDFADMGSVTRRHRRANRYPLSFCLMTRDT